MKSYEPAPPLPLSLTPHFFLKVCVKPVVGSGANVSHIFSTGQGNLKTGSTPIKCLIRFRMFLG